MHISFAVFADAANLSQEGKLNILGVFDAVQVAGLPAIHPRTHFVVRLKANGDDVGHHKLTFRWLSPFEEELWSSTGEMTVAFASLRAPEAPRTTPTITASTPRA